MTVDDRPAPPRVVGVAVWALYVGALLPVVSTVLEAVRRGVGTGDVVMTVVTCVLDCLVAFFVGRGKGFARVLVWLFAVLALFSLGDYLALIASGGDAGRPGWWFPSLLTIDLLQVITTAGAAALLVLPAARAYFQPRQPVVAGR